MADNTTTKETSQITIEEAFQKLEQLVETLENPDISLDDAFANYKEGMELLKFCNSSIDEVEKKVLAISKEGELYEF